MKKYTFKELNDIEFQDLINDLLEKRLKCRIERFKPGRDGGIDGRTAIVEGIGIIQTKHFRDSGVSQLLRKIKQEENAKAKKLAAGRYIFATSVNLNPNDKERIIKAFSDVALSSDDIYGNDEVNALLREFPEVHKTYYKLWSDSTDSLELFLHPEIHARESALKARLKRINLLFVETEDFRPALQSLNDNHVVVLSGEPGVGKTTLAEYLCQVHMRQGYSIDVVEGDITQYPINLLNPEKKVLLYFDDFLGANYFAAICGNQDSAIVRLIEQVRNEPNKRLVLTSRINIINKAEIFSQSFRSFGLSKRQYIIKINKYSRITKAKLLYNHLWHSNLDISRKQDIIKDDFFNKIIDHRNFNPRLIAHGLTADGEKSFSLSKSLHEHLERPDQIWDHCYTVQLDEQARILVKLCVASGGRVEEDSFAFAYERALVEYRFVPTSNQPTDFEYTLRLVCNSLLIRNLGENEITITQFNPSVSDYVIGKINNQHEARRLIKSLDSVRVVTFYSDLIMSGKMRRADAEAISVFLLERYINTVDQCFAVSLNIALYLKKEITQLKLAIEKFNSINFSKPVAIPSYCIASILEKAFSFGVGESKYLEILEATDFGHSRLNDLYSSISMDDGSFQKTIAMIKEKIVESLEKDIDEIISESDSLDDCVDEIDIKTFAESCIDALSDEYSMLDKKDIIRLKQAYSLQALKDSLHDRWNSNDDKIESETKSSQIISTISENQVINDMFRNFTQELNFAFERVTS